ncbi:hypothetical protein DFJ74DRAFT_767449 [Hyaloraphidium curvatum]|nr:hypothetical protein DFJ74DRAFT_767449 [Hyaloraphidium curvatum]
MPSEEPRAAGTVRPAAPTAPAPAVPPELFIPIMKELLAARAFGTVAKFLRCGRVCLELGLPVLLREVCLSEFSGFDTAEKIEAFSQDALGTGKFRFVRELFVGGLGGSPASSGGLGRVLAQALPHAEEATVILDNKEMAEKIWRHIDRATKLSALTISIKGDAAEFFDSSVELSLEIEYLRLDFDYDVDPSRILAMLDSRAPGVKELQTTTLFDLSVDLSRFPGVVSKLTSMLVDAAHLPALAALPGLELRILHLVGTIAGEAWEQLARIRGLRFLYLWGWFCTCDLAGLRAVRGLKTLSLSNPVLDLPEGRFGEMQKVVAAMGLERLTIDMDRGVTEGEAAERDMWKSLPVVRWREHRGRVPVW